VSIKPYYEHQGITIYHGDSRELVPLLGEISVVATDPPYGMNYASNRSPKHLQKGGVFGDDEFPSWVFGIEFSVAMFVFCRWDNLTDIPRPKSFIAWDKVSHGMGDLLHEFGRRWEGCAFYPGPSHKFNQRPVDVIQVPRVPAQKMVHPTEKPVDLLVRLLSCLRFDGMVLDPFMGCGSTLLASKAMGHKAVGIEIEERYCEIAAMRLSQDSLFYEEPSVAV